MNTDLVREADVVVIGGGIVGCSAAYFLAKRGVSVALVDKGDIAWEQSSRNWGWVRQNGRNLREIPAAIASVRLWSNLSEEVGDIGWLQSGNLDLAYSEEEVATMETWQEHAREAGLDVRMIGRSEAASLVPGVAGAFVGGSYVPSDGQADPHRAAPALARAAEQHGARIYSRCAVEEIEVAGDRITGVVTERGRIAAPVVVLAAGAWSSRLAWDIGLRLPQRAIRSTALATTVVEPVSRVVTWAEGVAFRQDHTGRFIVAGGGRSDYDVNLETVRHLRPFIRGIFDARRRGRMRLHAGRVLLRDLQTLMPRTPWRRNRFAHLREHEPPPNLETAWATFRRFREVLPGIESIGIERVWAGNIDYTPDATPVIDAVAQPHGLVISTGFSGHGFMLGPIGGHLAAQLAMGESPEVDVTPFRLSRFAEKDTNEHELKF